MSSIDERIVEMKFNNGQFESAAKKTMGTLDGLKKGLNMDAQQKSLSGLSDAGKRFSLDGIGQAIEGIQSKFSALSIVGITALANIANRAVDTGIRMAKSLSTDQIMAGFQEYELKMGSIQTILANTARHGTGLDEVTANLDELNDYADKTIYNFGDMTRNIGLFTNAGIKVGDATSMIKGFSNEAAASGTNAQGAAGAAYQLSQALSAGTIRLMDWRSLQNVGMGNKNMQNGLIEIADAMGTLEANTTSAEEVQGDFNGSLEKNWLSADVMSNYLRIMAGDMDEASQKALGLSDDTIKMFAKQQTMGEEAATKVRTWTQLIGTLQESVGSSWAQTFDILLGDFDQATELFTKVNDTLGPIIGKAGEARNDLLKGWADAGGRDMALESITNTFKALMTVIKPIREAFRNIFPPVTVDTIVNITKSIRDFAKTLGLGAYDSENLRRTFEGIFAVLDIGWMIIQKVFGLFGRLFGQVTQGTGGFLKFTAAIGDWLVGVRDAIKEGTALDKVFGFIGDVISNVVGWLGQLGEATVDAASNLPTFGEFWESVGNAMKKVGDALRPAINWIKEAYAQVKEVLGDFFKTMDFNVLVGALNVGALGGLALVIKKAVDKITDIFKGGPGGLVDSIKEVFGAITDTFGAMQAKLKSDALMKIAISIGILTAAVVVLSFINTGKLFTALGAISIMFVQLSGILIALDKLTVNPGKMVAISGAMIVLAGGMVLMAAAIKIMSTLSWSEVATGLTVMTGALVGMVGALQIMSGMKAKVAVIAPALVVLSVAMLAIAGALKIMATLSWDEVGRSMTVFAGTLAIMVGAMAVAKTAVGGAASIVLAATALTIVGGALQSFAQLSWDEIGRAMVVMAGAMAIMVGGMMLLALMPSTALGAASLILAATALTILMKPLKEFAKFSWDEIGRAMVVLAGSLIILGAAMALMGVPLVALGGLALAVVATGMMLLAPALVLLGGMSWDEIGRGLTMLAASLGIMAVLGVLLIPASVGFLLLGTAILLIGAGTLMAGIGVSALAVGITALAAAGALGTEALKQMVLTIINLIPEAMAAFAQGLIDFAVVIVEGQEQFTEAFKSLIMALLNAINEVGPQIIDTLSNLLMALFNKIVENVPLFVDGGLRMINGVLDGIASNIGGIITSATDIVVNFIDGIANNLPRVIQSGVDLIVKFIDGISSSIENNSARLGAAGGNLAVSIIQGMANGLWSGASTVIDAAVGMASNALQGAKNLLGINSPSKAFHEVGIFSTDGMANGFTDGSIKVTKASEKVGLSAVSAMKNSLSGISDAVSTDMDMQPSIRPVVDLTDVKEKAGAMTGILGTRRSIDVSGNYATASDISTDRQETEDAKATETTKSEPSITNLNFNQTNTSPKALSAAEIYRKTRSQLSRAVELSKQPA